MADRAYESYVEPEVGGEARVSVDGWGGWHVWIDIVPYHAPNRPADVPLSPRNALSVARRLTIAAVICWWRTRKDTRRG